MRQRIIEPDETAGGTGTAVMTTPVDREDGANGRNEPLLKLDEYLPYRLNVLAETVREPLSRHYADSHGIGMPEWRVAAVLGQHGTMTAKDIGRIGRMHKTKVSRALSVLESRHLVAREINSADMREAFVSLTDEGRRLYSTLADSALTYGERLTAALSNEERAVFDQMLQRLLAHSESLSKEWNAKNGTRGG
jgi:DNA-binding MarR family transcriptional regulator